MWEGGRKGGRDGGMEGWRDGGMEGGMGDLLHTFLMETLCVMGTLCYAVMETQLIRHLLNPHS